MRENLSAADLLDRDANLAVVTRRTDRVRATQLLTVERRAQSNVLSLHKPVLGCELGRKIELHADAIRRLRPHLCNTQAGDSSASSPVAVWVRALKVLHLGEQRRRCSPCTPSLPCDKNELRSGTLNVATSSTGRTARCQPASSVDQSGPIAAVRSARRCAEKLRRKRPQHVERALHAPMRFVGAVAQPDHPVGSVLHVILAFPSALLPAISVRVARPATRAAPPTARAETR